jgi:hypothetical protein
MQPGQPGAGYNPFPQPNQPNVGVGAPTGSATPGQPNQALGLIQQILTTQRQAPTNQGGLTGGGPGIAGVASTADGLGIHVINEHNKYKEWEFIYDLKNDKSALGQAQQLQQLQQMQPQQHVQPQPPLQLSPQPASPPQPSR